MLGVGCFAEEKFVQMRLSNESFSDWIHVDVELLVQEFFEVPASAAAKAGFSVGVFWRG